MESKILVVAPYPEMGKMAEDLGPTMNAPLIVVGGCLPGEVIPALKDVDLADVSAVVCQGLTAEFLKNMVPDVPIIRVNITSADIIRALNPFLNREKALIVVSHEIISDLENMGRDLSPGFQVIKMVGNNIEEILAKTEVKLREALVDGIKNVVGETYVTYIARRLGMKTIQIQSSRESICDAITEARQAAEIVEMYREKANCFKAMLNYSHEGIMLVDANGIITVFNSAAERITGVRAHDAIGNAVGEVFAAGRTLRVLRENRDEIDVVENLGGERIITNRIIVRSGGKSVGVLCTFQDVFYVQKAEAHLKRDADLRGHVARYTFNDIIGRSPTIREAVTTAKRFSQSDATILIYGETGTGKELFAQSIHNNSTRRPKPFVAINCAALPETLLESELFGYVKGAFTGASKEGKPGLFELAHQGTIFLDEIAEMAPTLQARMLRVIQQKEVMRLGHDRVIPIDVRVIASTNVELGTQVRQNRFRSDLYYRLNVLNLFLPPLRKRKEDIPLLLHYFFSQFARENRRPIHCSFNESIIGPLFQHDWPGNLRELENIARRLFLLTAELENCTEGILENLIKEILREAQYNEGEIDADPILQVLNQAKNNKTKAAEILGISRTTLWRRLQSHGSRNGALPQYRSPSRGE